MRLKELLPKESAKCELMEGNELKVEPISSVTRKKRNKPGW